jgi:endonuclease/exonuclease/phosphatase family metal-dependent hydrolase
MRTRLMIVYLLLAGACWAGELAEPQIDPAAGAVLIPWDKADQYAGQMAVVYGRIVAAGTTDWNCYLNFHEDYRNHLSVSIPASAFERFPQPPEDMYDKHRVAVFGRISGEGRAPQMYVSSPDQIQVVPEDEEDMLYFAASRYPAARTPEDLAALRKKREVTDTIRFGTYNVLNFFDEFDDPYRADEVMEVKSRDALKKLAARIRDLDADVLCMQEVENRFILERFVNGMLPDMGYDYVVLIEANNERGIDCALVSRFPIGPATTYQHLTFKGPDGKSYRFQRDLLQVHVAAPKGFEFEAFCVHLKSKYGGEKESEPIRMAEATEIRKVVDEMLAKDPKARFIIAGDCNDLWDSNSLQIIRGSGDTELTCPGVELEEDQRITYNKDPYRSMIDFILCSPEMRRRYVEGSYRIIPGTVNDSGSDHNPSVATFRID